MSTAEAPLDRLCSRQTCRRPARTTLTFVYSDSTAVIGPLSVHAEPHAYDLCVPHAQRMTPPRGWEIVRLEGITDSQDEEAPAAQRGDLVADSAPLAPLSTLPGAARTHAPAADAGSQTQSPQADDEDAAGDDAPGNPFGSASKGWGRRRRSRLRAVSSSGHKEPAEESVEDSGEASSSAPEEAPVAAIPEHPSVSGGRAAGLRAVSDPVQEREPVQGIDDPGEAGSLHGEDGAFDSLTDEIFASHSTVYVPARRAARPQPEGMRRPHLRRGRS